MDISAEERRNAFSIWLRTGIWPGVGKVIEVKFNPWHDPDNGRFTFAGSGEFYGDGGGAETRPRPRLTTVGPSRDRATYNERVRERDTWIARNDPTRSLYDYTDWDARLANDAAQLDAAERAAAPALAESDRELLGAIALGPGLGAVAAGGRLAVQWYRALQAIEEFGDLGNAIGILRDAALQKGNSGLGQATARDALNLGEAWVGEGYKTARNGRALISADGLRQFRPPSYKSKLGISQANFEQRLNPTGKWQNNGHLDIIP